MLITLTTDFGYKDSFVGVMKGVILGINPEACIVDLTHGIPPQDILAAALSLRYSSLYFPPQTIHVAVVDPGVGGRRRPLLIQSGSRYFIGPDNGVLSLAVREREPIHVVELSNPSYQLQPTSATFHGRDIFAAAAAYLSIGIPPPAFGATVADYARLALPQPRRSAAAIAGEIVYIDSFGNLFTNIEENDLAGLARDRLTISVGSVSVRGLAANYSAARDRNYVALINSWGVLEIALYKDSAQKRTGAKVGDKIHLVVD